MSDVTLLEAIFPRTLDELVARFSAPEWLGCRIEAWVFEDLAARRQAGATLADSGVEAVFRSAYKPLLHAYLDDGLPAGPIALPTHPDAAPGRFALEAYPLLGLSLGTWTLVPGSSPLDYGLSDGTTVFAPNRVRHDSHGAVALSCCGWLRVWHDRALLIDEAVPTEFEQAFDAVMAAVAAHRWPESMPFFKTLHVDVQTGGIGRRLDLGHECMDTQEALHEDLYFSLIEWFQVIAGLPPGDRTLQPGQIVPEISHTTGATRVRVRLISGLPEPVALGDEPVDAAVRALDAGQIARILLALPGDRFAAQSVQGRSVDGLYRPGALPGLVVTAGQHANETSGVVGLLRAAPLLLARAGAELALVATENPDGYALHRRLCATHPRHMHHAARYTAFGDDLGARAAPPYYEADARREAIARTRAVLHISLHGYPAQEWTRPLSGYVPSGFAGWTLPCGFFLIMRHHPGCQAEAMRFLDALTERLSANTELVAMNRAQLALRHAHLAATDGLMLHDIQCRVAEDTRSPVPFTLITEYPDETIEGDAFRQAHLVQRDTVLHAAELLWAGVFSGEAGA